MAGVRRMRRACNHEPMSRAPLEWAIAGCAAAWAVTRLGQADRHPPLERAAVPVVAFTPQAAAAAGLAALTMRNKGPAITTGLAAAAMAALVAPRAIRRRQPDAQGPLLRVLTVNLLAGGAAGPELVGLVRHTGADVLFVQELSDEAVNRLKRAGLSELLPNEMPDTEGYGHRGSGIYARYPLSDGLRMQPTSASQPTARLDLPSGQRLQLVCVHPHPPAPPWHRHSVSRWRGELAVLPRGGDPSVILAGDFNATLDHAHFRRLLRLGYVDAGSQAGNGLVPTWGPEPTGRPALLTVDHVLVDPRCAVLATAAYRISGSDHRALYAKIRLPA